MKQFATVTVIGRDKTGVIARVTNFLFEQHANIEALEEQVTRGQFSMTLQASWKWGVCDSRHAPHRPGRAGAPARHGNQAAPDRAEPPPAVRHFGHKETHCFDALMAAKAAKADDALVIGNYADFAPLRQKIQAAVRPICRGTTAPGPRRGRCNCWRSTRLISSCWRGS